MSSLVRIDRETAPKPILQIAHSSVKDYLISPLHNPWQHKFQETPARADILRICLAYLGTYGAGHPDFPDSLLGYVEWNLLSNAKFQGVEEEAHEHIIKFLIVNNFKIRDFGSGMSVYRYNGPPLYVASALGLTWTVKQLLEKGIDANEDPEHLFDGASASPYYRELITKYIPSKLVKPRVYIPNPHNALTVASTYRHNEVVQLLLDNGARINSALERGVDPLWDACCLQNTNLVKILLERWPKDNAERRNLGYRLSAACTTSGTESIRLLLDNGADVNAKDRLMGSGLYVASSEGDRAQVRMLITAGADVNALGGAYGTALQAACRSCRGSIRSKPDDPDFSIADKNRNFADLAEFKSNIKQVIRILLEYGANPDSVEIQYREPVEDVIREMEDEKQNNATVRDTPVA